MTVSTVESLTLNVNQEIQVHASLNATFDALLEQMGPANQTPDGEARRDDANFCHASVWEWTGNPAAPALHKEPLVFENVHLATRSYK